MILSGEYFGCRRCKGCDASSRTLILGFKHADRTEGAAGYGAWLARAGAELVAEADLIAPVPLHWLRLFNRRFNQAAGNFRRLPLKS